MKQFRKIGILTSGGDAPGMNAFVRAAARTALANGVEVCGIMEGYSGLIHGNVKNITPTDVCHIIARSGTILYTDRCDDFRSVEGRKKAMEMCGKLGIDGLIVCGGDGTFKGATKFVREGGIPTIGVPGTIDADIASTDYTIGFDTAMNTVIDMVDRLRDTCESHARCNVVEVMGRHAGHIAVRSAIAVGASAVAIPEIEFDEEHALKTIINQRNAGQRGIIVIVSEGVQGYAQKLTDIITEKTGVKARYACLAHVQRGGSPTLEDRLAASEMGVAAVEKLLAGKNDVVICRRNGVISDMDITHALILDDLYKGKARIEDIETLTPEELKDMKRRCADIKKSLTEYYRIANLIRACPDNPEKA